MRPLHYLLAAVWLLWLACWGLFAFNVKTPVRQESLGSRLLHFVPLWLAVFLLWAPKMRIAILGERFLPTAAWPFWVGSALTLLGLLFTVWARVHLGRNWSGTVTVKQDHQLIMSGPYRLVRHPIYTGLVVAFVGAAIARGEWRGILAVVLVLAAFWRKLRLEERWMREQFGDVYTAYSESVPALIPFPRRDP